MRLFFEFKKKYQQIVKNKRGTINWVIETPTYSILPFLQLFVAWAHSSGGGGDGHIKTFDWAIPVSVMKMSQCAAQSPWLQTKNKSRLRWISQKTSDKIRFKKVISKSLFFWDVA